MSAACPLQLRGNRHQQGSYDAIWQRGLVHDRQHRIPLLQRQRHRHWRLRAGRRSRLTRHFRRRAAVPVAGTCVIVQCWYSTVIACAVIELAAAVVMFWPVTATTNVPVSVSVRVPDRGFALPAVKINDEIYDCVFVPVLMMDASQYQAVCAAPVAASDPTI